MITIFVLLLFTSIGCEAVAGFKGVRPGEGSEKRVKCGNYYFWYTSGETEGDTCKVYCSKQKTGKGTLLFEADEFYSSQLLLTNDSTVYYTKIYDNYKKSSIYRVNILGQKRGKIKSFPYIAWLQNMYGKTIYYNRVAENNNLYTLSLDTKKPKICAKNCSVRYADGGRYMYLGDTSERYGFKVYDCKNKKIIRGVKKPSKGYKLYRVIVSDKKLFVAFSCSQESGFTYKIYKYNLDGTKGKLIKTLKNTHQLGSISSRYIYYAKWNSGAGYYRYTIKTKKSVRISQEQYKSA